MAMTYVEIVDDALEKIELRYRLSKMDNLLENPPTPEEAEEFIFDALQDINSFPPQTFFTVEQAYDSDATGYDPRWKTLLFLGICKYAILQQVIHWTGEGLEGRIDELVAENKRPDYESLLSIITDEFDTKCERLKQTSQKFIRHVNGADIPSTVLSGGRTSTIITTWMSRVARTT